MSSMNRDFSLAFSLPVTQFPGQMWTLEQQRTTSHTFTISDAEDRLRSDSPLPPGVDLDESLLVEGRRGNKIGTFTAEVNEELGRLTVSHDEWWSHLGYLWEDFWPEHLGEDTVPMSAYIARDKPHVDSASIPGYGPALEHPLEPIMGNENHERYLGSAKTQRLAEGFRTIKGTAQEKNYLENVARLPNSGERSRTRYLFLRDGVLATAEIGGIVLFTDFEWFEPAR